MSKPQVNEHEYAKLVHEKMQEHKLYKDGMGVKVYPEDSKAPSGLTIIGDYDARTILAWAEQEVQKEYDLVITRYV